MHPEVRHCGLILAQTTSGLNSARDIMSAYNMREPDYNKKASTFVSGTQDSVVQAFKSGGAGAPRVLVVIGRLLEGFDHKPVTVCAIYRNVAEKSKVRRQLIPLA
jgi:hypothetical protein